VELLAALWLAAAAGGDAPSGIQAAQDATHQASADKEIVLHASLDDSALQSYRALSFDVPPGTVRLAVAFSYTGRDRGTTIDLGLLGPGEHFTAPNGFRGWSGGNKKTFTLSATDATPSYLPGPIEPGRWSLLLGVPNIRRGETTEVTATIRFDRAPETVIRAEAGWYRGDLHMHTGYSDGSCANQSGVRVPCPLFLTLQAAADRGLDFIAVTEHNTPSHIDELNASQPYFDRMLLIPGMEVTTFVGHANAFGISGPVDFRVAGERTWNDVLESLSRQGVVVSINHPGAPSGERCMGCGWTASESADLSRVQAIEAVNGADAETPVSGIPFWHAQLNKGLRLTAIGGSDNHDAKLAESSLGRSRIGAPTTVMYAQVLSVRGIQEAIRTGNVFIDVQGTRDRAMQMSARAGNDSAQMGGELSVRKGRDAVFALTVHNLADARIEWIRDGEVVHAAPRDPYTFKFRGDGSRHWIRANIRDGSGHLALVGNPIYLIAPH
jgi:hypothetical protein